MNTGLLGICRPLGSQRSGESAVTVQCCSLSHGLHNLRYLLTTWSLLKEHPAMGKMSTGTLFLLFSQSLFNKSPCQAGGCTAWGWAVVVGNAVSVYTVGCVAGLLRLPRHVQPAFPVHRSWGNGRELHKAAFLVISAQISRDSWTEAVFTACSEGEVEWMVDLKKTVYTFLPICRQLVFVVVVWARKHLVMQPVWAL